MQTNEVPHQLQTLLSGVFDIDPENITNDLDAGNAEFWDSFTHLQAILTIEMEYGIHFDASRIPTLTSISSLLDELKRKGVTFN
jgi:acyl carrier protein